VKPLRAAPITAERLARAVVQELELLGLPWVRAAAAGPERATGTGVAAIVSCVCGRAVYIECLGTVRHPCRLDRRRRERFHAENAVYLELRDTQTVAPSIRVLTAQIAAAVRS